MGPYKLETIKRTVKNRIDYIDIYVQFKKDGDFRKRFAARDTLMAEERDLVCERTLPARENNYLSHNYHIARSNEKETVMGEVLADKFGVDLYSVGVFSGKGERAGNSRKPEKLAEPTSERGYTGHRRLYLGRSGILDIPKSGGMDRAVI